jgi:putative membrane protein
MSKTPSFVLAGLTTVIQLASAPLFAQQEPDPTPPPRGTTSFTPLPDMEKQPLTASTFVARAAIVNLSEIELGELALAKSADPAVKEFAEQLVQDHRAANEQLKTAAADQHVSLPGTVDEDHRKLKQELSALDEKAFDAQYIEAMNTGHDKAVALFEAASQAPQLPAALKSYADDALVQVKEHRKTAVALGAAEGVDD